MDIKLFSLYKQEVSESEAGKECILKCIKSFFPDSLAFSNFTSQKRMLLAVSQSLRSADIVVIAVQGNMYNATKRLLSSALDLKMSANPEVSSALAELLEKNKIKQGTFDTNILFPNGAEVLPTDSNLNCGFALSSGGQHIIYLPIEAPRAQEVVLGSLYDYLADICEEDCENAFDTRHKAIIKRTAEKISEKMIKVTFAGANTAELVKKYTAKSEEKSCFNFAEPMHFDALSDNLVDEARKIRDDYYSHLSVLVSDITEDAVTSERFVIMAIADESGTSTMKMFAQSNETDEEFILNCIDKLLLILYDFESLSDCIDEADIVTKSDKALRQRLFAIASGAIGITAVAGFIVALILNNGG